MLEADLRDRLMAGIAHNSDRASNYYINPEVGSGQVVALPTCFRLEVAMQAGHVVTHVG